MKFLILTALCISSLSSAWAAKPNKTAQPEIYAAMDINDAVPATVAPRGAAVNPSTRKVPAPAYDAVPTDQVEPLSVRLKLAETLVRKHGRAYDYRAHTIKELESLLAQLDAALAAQDENH